MTNLYEKTRKLPWWVPPLTWMIVAGTAMALWVWMGVVVWTTVTR